MNIGKKIFAICVPLMFLVVLIPSASALNIEDDAQEIKESEYAVYTDREVTIFGGSSTSLDILLDQSTSKAEVVQKFEQVSQGDIVVLDPAWVNLNNIDYVSTNVKSLLDVGSPVICMGESKTILENPDVFSGACSFEEDATACGIWVDPNSGGIYSYSTNCENISDAIALAYKWADNVLSNPEQSAVSSSQPYWSFLYRADRDRDCWSTVLGKRVQYGIYSVGTVYEVLVNRPIQHVMDDGDNQFYNYYATHYFVQTDPKSTFSTSDIQVMSPYDIANAGYEIVRYGPTSSVGTSHTEVDISVSFSAGNVGCTVSKKWEENISGIPITDRTSLSNDELSITYDIPEDKIAGQHSFYVQPGCLIAAPCIGHSGSTFCPPDTYNIKFCKDSGRVLGYTHYTNFNLNLAPTLHAPDVCVTIDSNGGTFRPDGSTTKELIAPLGSVLPLPGSFYLIRDGHTFLGYSENPNDSEPTYTSAIAQESLKLYAIWS